MELIKTSIPEVKILKPKVFNDERGFFMETWQQEYFNKHVSGYETNFVQDNQSFSSKGVLRGLHFQRFNKQGKLVRVATGAVFDVAVDIRVGSPTFGKWVGEVLSAENQRMLWIPEGFAHGFCVLSSEATFLYKCTDFYNPDGNVTIAWNDKDLNIKWPSTDVNLSYGDKNGISLEQCIKDNILL